MATKTTSAPAATDEVKGSTWLAEHVNSETGSSYDGYGIRILLRSLVKEGTIERGDGRWTFSGVKDKTVLAVIKAVKSGSADKAKQARLDELKAKREEKAAAAADAKPARSRAKKAAPAAAEADELDDAAEDDDLDIDDI